MIYTVPVVYSQPAKFNADAHFSGDVAYEGNIVAGKNLEVDGQLLLNTLGDLKTKDESFLAETSEEDGTIVHEVGLKDIGTTISAEMNSTNDAIDTLTFTYDKLPLTQINNTYDHFPKIKTNMISMGWIPLYAPNVQVGFKHNGQYDYTHLIVSDGDDANDIYNSTHYASFSLVAAKRRNNRALALNFEWLFAGQSYVNGIYGIGLIIEAGGAGKHWGLYHYNKSDGYDVAYVDWGQFGTHSGSYVTAYKQLAFIDNIPTYYEHILSVTGVNNGKDILMAKIRVISKSKDTLTALPKGTHSTTGSLVVDGSLVPLIEYDSDNGFGFVSLDTDSLGIRRSTDVYTDITFTVTDTVTEVS